MPGWIISCERSARVALITRLTYYQAIAKGNPQFGKEIMRQHCSSPDGADKRGEGLLFSWLLTGCIVLGFLGGASCATGAASQQPENASGNPGQTVTPPIVIPPVSPGPPTTTLPPPAVPQDTGQPDQQATPSTGPNTPAGETLDATVLITTPALKLTLTVDDMGAGWVRGNAIAPAIQQVTSSSHVYYTQGSSFAPGVQNTVAVFRTLSMANNAYAKEKQANLTVSNPYIGDECFLNDSVSINKLLVFRKNNVVVWLWVKQYKEGDIERYARIVEQRINASALKPVQQGPSSQTAVTPALQGPVETTGNYEPTVPKAASGLVTRQAYQMVLAAEDMGAGWAKGNVSSPSAGNSLSSSYVTYSQGSSFAPTVQNTVVVYRSIESAISAYTVAKPSGASLLYPAIGDECFVNNSVAIDRVLVCRKSNVLVWIWLKQYKSGDIEGYARAVEKKITF